MSGIASISIVVEKYHVVSHIRGDHPSGPTSHAVRIMHPNPDPSNVRHRNVDKWAIPASRLDDDA
jgi:hypothetical protein